MRCSACGGSGLITVNRVDRTTERTKDGDEMNKIVGHSLRPCPMGCKPKPRSDGVAGNGRLAGAERQLPKDEPRGDDYDGAGDTLDAIKHYTS